MFDCSNDQVFVWKRHCAKKWATWRWERRCQKRQFCHLTLDARQETGSSWFEPNPKNSIKRLQLMTGLLIVAYDSNHALSKIKIHKSLYFCYGTQWVEWKWAKVKSTTRKRAPQSTNISYWKSGAFFKKRSDVPVEAAPSSLCIRRPIWVLVIACCRCHIFCMSST